MSAAVGSQTAAELSRAFLADTIAAVQAIEWARPVVATTHPIDVPEGVEMWFQGEGDPGTRLERIIRKALTDAPFAIAIRADSAALPSRMLSEARETLVRTEAVIGPAFDGGLYLLGLRRCPPDLLAALPWNARETFARIRERLEERGMFPRLLDPWFDVDRPEDLEHLRRALARGQIRAPETERALQAVHI